MKTILRRLARLQIIEVLSDPPFFSFSLSVLLSQVGFNMLNVVLIFQIFHITGSNFSVAILVLTYLLPQIVLSFVGGIVADMRNKKHILVWGNILRAVVLFFLFLNSNSITVIYTVSLIISVITQFYVPAESPMIPYLVKRDKLVGANSIFGMGLFGSILASYVLAGPAITILGRSHVFIVLALIFTLAAFFAYLIPGEAFQKHVTVERKYIIRQLRLTFREELILSFKMLKQTTKVARAFFLLIISQVIILVLACVVPGYAKGILQVPAEDLSVLLFAPAAIGMIVAALAISGIFRNASREKIMTYGIFISALVLILFPFTSKFVSRAYIQPINYVLPMFLQINAFNVVNILAFFAGVSNAMIFIPSQTLIQETTPENFQSKIYGLLFALIGVFSFIPIILAGTIADIIGVETVLVGLGLIVFLIGLSRTPILSIKNILRI